jgi:bleomycin hydrolase
MHDSGRSITPEAIQDYICQYEQDPIKQATANAIARSGLQASSFRNQALREIRHVFSVDIKTMPATNQKASGRCWLFAGLNLLREHIAQPLKLEDFQLSQNYLAFWDKFEKINYFLESILDTLDEPTEGRLISWLMTSLQDGGQWDMFVNLVEKYGLVPQQAMPETANSEATRACNTVINTRLRRVSADWRRQYRAGTDRAALAMQKQAVLTELYGTLCQCFGPPPSRLTWEFADKDRQYTAMPDLTPLDFYHRLVTLPLRDYVSIIHAPTADKPFKHTFTVRYINNVVDGRPILYLNLDLPDFKQLVLRQLQDGEVVWFGSDVGHDGDRDRGAWFGDLYDYAGVLQLDLAMSKADQLDYRQSAMNHAMLLTGVNLADGRPNRWKIENSWGEEPGNKGYYVADDCWFDRYVYQAVVRRSYLAPDLLAALETKPIELEPWDPMGTLAGCSAVDLY